MKGPPAERPPSLLRQERFRLLFLGKTASSLGDYLSPVALSFAVLDVAGSAAALGVVLAAQTVPQLLFLLVGGAVADRLRPQRLIPVTDSIAGTAQAVTAFLVLTDQAALWHLAALQAVYGTAMAFYRPASSAVVPFTVSEQDLGRANGLLGASTSVMSTVGPAAGGILVATHGSGWAVAADALTFFVSASFLWPLRRAAGRAGVAESNVRADIREGWREFVSRRWLVSSVAYFSFFHVVYLAPMLVLGPVVARRSLGGASAWALILALGGLGGALGGLVAARRMPRRSLAAMAVAGFVWPPELALLAVAAPLALIGAAALVGGVAVGYSVTVWLTVLQEHVPRHALSRVSSYDWLGSVLFYPLGTIAVGALGDGAGPRPALLLCAVVLALSTAALLSVREVRDLAAPAPAPGTT